MRQRTQQNNHENDLTSYSILRLYNDAFRYAVPFLLLILLAQIFLDDSWENTLLLSNILCANFFFWIFKKNETVIKYQVCFHQAFVTIALVIATLWFIRFPYTKPLFYLLFIGGIATYLLVYFLTTIVYFLVYHSFLLVLTFYFPILKVEHVVYSVVFSSGAYIVSKWIDQLINDSKSLQASQRNYKSLFEYGNNAVFILKPVDDRFQILECNGHCEAVFGFQKEELIETWFHELSKDSDEKKDELCKSIKQLQNQERFHVECLFERKNKERFYADASFVGVHLEEGLVVQVLVKDISEKKVNEIKLSETVQSFKNIVDNSPASIFIFSENELVYKNSNGDQLYRELLDDTQTNIFEIFPKKQKYLLTELIGEASNKVSSYTEISLGKEHAEKRMSMSVVKVVYKGKNSILLLLTDITLQNEYNVQKIRAEIAEETNKKLSEEIRRHRDTQIDLIENTSKLNALFESSSSLFILTIDRDLNISSFNSSFRNMMKEYLAVDVEIGDDFLNTFPIEEAAYGKLIKRFKRALRGDSVEIISHFPTLKGEIWVESFISPVRVEGEAIKEIAFIAHNITEKVESERKVLDSEANNKATVSAIPDMLFKINKEGYFTDFRLNEEGDALLNVKDFAHTSSLLGKHITEVFKDKNLARSFLLNIKKALKTGAVHTQNFIIPFIIGKTDKKMYFENRYSRVNASEVIVITRDVTDKVEFETRLIESVREKEVLLKEVHHRVKNNLQVISSILNLQSSYVEDEKTLEIINESQNRIRSMSYIHESLYQTKDFSSINFHDYITNLVQNLVHSYQLYTGKTKLNLDIDRVQLILDQAIPCGLILNELVSNSLKYAYPEGEGGEIQIEIKEVDGKVKIRVEDFGTGLPKGFKIEESDSLGLGLVDTLVDQIDGELILETDNGTKYLIIFEKQDL